MSSLLTLAKDLEQKSTEQRQNTAAMLRAAFSEHEASVKLELTSSAQRINAAISAHDQTMKAAIASHTKGLLKTVGRTWLFITGVSFLLICTSGGILWWQGQQIASNLDIISGQTRTQAILSEKNSGVQLSVCGERKRQCVKVNPEAGQYGTDSAWMILAGK